MKLWNSQLYCWNSLNDDSTTDAMDSIMKSMAIKRTALLLKNPCTVSICFFICVLQIADQAHEEDGTGGALADEEYERTVHCKADGFRTERSTHHTD